MSDVGSDAEDFGVARHTSASRKKTHRDDEYVEGKDTDPKRARIHATEKEDDAAAEDAGVVVARRGDVPLPSFERPAYVIPAEAQRIYVKTLNVHDICSIITGCCSLPGTEYVMIIFTPKGMEFYSKPTKIAPLVVQSFYSKAHFTVYNVTSEVKHVVLKGELDDLKRRVAKDVEFLEITENSDGFVVGGRRTYKKGGGCDFNINLTSMDENMVSVVNMDAFTFNLQVRTASQHFADNVAFFDDQVKWIQILVKPNLLEFKGIRDTGAVSKVINQLINDGFSGEYQAMFNKKVLKAVTSTRDINQTLCISLNQAEADFPVHFMYEMGHDHSHFSVYIVPAGAEEV